VVNSYELAKKCSSAAQDLNSEMKYVKQTLALNGYLKCMIQKKKKKKHNKSPELTCNVILPYMADMGETSKRILGKHRIRTNFKPTIKLSTIPGLPPGRWLPGNWSPLKISKSYSVVWYKKLPSFCPSPSRDSITISYNHFDPAKISAGWPCTNLSSGKDIVPGSKRWGVVFEIPSGECEYK